MALTMRIDSPKNARPFRCSRKLWLTADRSRLVPDGDPEAAFLFCVPGHTITIGEAIGYGLIESEPDALMASKELQPQTKVVYPQETKRQRGRPRKIKS